MEKDKIPTAEELFTSEIEDGIVPDNIDWLKMQSPLIYTIIRKRIMNMANKHARNHVKAALEAASHVLDVNGDADYIEHPTAERIISSYNLNEIK